MRIYYDNKWLGPGNKSASSEAAGFPLTNLNDYIVATKWRAAGKTDEWVKYDAGSGNTIAVEDVGIIGHNFSSGCTVKVQGNASDVWTSPSVDETVTYRAGIMHKAFTGGAYRFWRVSIADSGNPLPYVEMGYLFIGASLELGDIWYREFPMQDNDTSMMKKTRSGQSYGNIGYYERSFSIQFPRVEATRQALLDAWWGFVGMHYPFIIFIDENSLTTFPPRFVIFNQPWDWNHIIGEWWNLQVSAEEVF